MPSLPPFDENATCQACGYTIVRTTYHAGVMRDFGSCSDFFNTSYPPSHLVRTCGRCTRTWYERPLDEPSESSDEKTPSPK